MSSPPPCISLGSTVTTVWVDFHESDWLLNAIIWARYWSTTGAAAVVKEVGFLVGALLSGVRTSGSSDDEFLSYSLLWELNWVDLPAGVIMLPSLFAAAVVKEDLGFLVGALPSGVRTSGSSDDEFLPYSPLWGLNCASAHVFKIVYLFS